MSASNVSDGQVVGIHYKLTVDDKVVDSSEGQEPLEYLHGHGNLVPGLEDELAGRPIGDKFAVSVPPAKGYGERDENGVQSIPRDQFPADMDLQPGLALRGEMGNGEVVMMRVMGIADDTVTVDLNHPLAGATLNFDIEVVSMRDATDEEKEHGHAHGPGGHQH